MAGPRALSAAATSIVGLLDHELPGLVQLAAVPRARLFRTEDLDTRKADVPRPTVSVFVHRVDFDKVTRAAFATSALPDGHPYLPLEIRFLLTPWADNPEDELFLLGAAMLILERRPIIGANLLDSSGDWELTEAIQVVMEDMTTEAVMRMFDSLPVDYHLSVPYVARIVKLALPQASADLTTTVRMDFVPTVDAELVAS
jgi:Pvc16 N-terminal domain